MNRRSFLTAVAAAPVAAALPAPQQIPLRVRSASCPSAPWDPTMLAEQRARRRSQYIAAWDPACPGPPLIFEQRNDGRIVLAG